MFKKGQSGNPKGRPVGTKNGLPLGLARKIREATGDGDELVKYALAVMRDKEERTADRLMALGWLSDRGYGIKQTIEIEQPEEHNIKIDPANLNKKDLVALAKILRSASDRSAT